MFVIGTILSKVTKVVTLPVDIVESAVDLATGGDGSKASKKSSGIPLASNLRDKACEAMEDLDD